MPPSKKQTPPKPKTTKKVTAAAAPPKKRSRWLTALRVLLILLSCIATALLILSAYAGYLSPSLYPGVSILVMVFPIFLLATVILGVIDLLLCRKALLIVILGLAATLPSIWDFCPLNIVSPKVPEEARGRTFRMMTYNVLNFQDRRDIYPDSINPTISYILRSGADVVNLQECPTFYSERYMIAAEQRDSLYKIYPYVLLYGKSQALLSKYPAETIEIGAPMKGVNEIAAFRLNIEGELITIFDLHLQAYSLTAKDKELFKEVTSLKADSKQELSAVRKQLFSKIQRAAEGREYDTQRLAGYIRKYGGPNVIIAGDFNDVPGCYTLRKLQESGFREVYPEVAFGPTITYNSDRFYFRIDHVLYRGDLKPLSIRRGKIKCSDHYPLIVEFAVTGE